MANFYLCLVIFRILLPIVLGSCVVFRPCAISAVYFLFLLLLPLVSTPTVSSMSSVTGVYLRLLISTSLIFAVAQIAFQVVLLAMPPYGHFLTFCEGLEEIFRNVGLVRLDDLEVVDVVTWISPEIAMVIATVSVYVVLNKLLEKRTVDQVENQENLPQRGATASKKQMALLVAVGKYAVLVALCVAAVLRPSVPGGLYFLVFLASATWWACCRDLGKAFAIVMRCLMVVLVVHMSVLYAYQFQWPQEQLDANSTYARYFGLTPIFRVNCTDDPRGFVHEDAEWATFVNPIALFLLYYVLALESKFLLKPQLIAVVSPSRRYGSGKRQPVYQDSTGSFTITDDIPMDQLEEEYKPTMLENVMFALESLLQVLIKTSYIATNIIMMAWSITYLSWITFVLLLWANLLWLVPNQRKSMLRSSPFLVAYAWFLLISAYAYSMNLLESELPTKVNGVDLEEIGFKRVAVLPCNPLLVKCLFTGMFWITLRQFVRERIEEKQASALTAMAAPLQVTVNTAASAQQNEDPSSKFMDKVGTYLRQCLTKFWIWVVAITLFAVAITGERMTAFRIIYMALFLFFILSFQISFRAWRRMMFGFWLTVIVYSMAILVMVYTYQFNNFDVYWRDYLHVPIQRQLDIGLEKFVTTQLFVRLVTPTFFVVITVVQLHYFHKDFMVLSDPHNTSLIQADLDQSSLQGGAPKSDKDEPSSLKEVTETESNRTLWNRFLNSFHYFVHLAFLFLELHMPKFVIFFLMLVCIYDKCALYFVLVILIVLACTFGRPMQIFAIYTSSIFVSLMLLARMIYQTQYIDPNIWNATCEWRNFTEEGNDAAWLGFNKTTQSVKLPGLVKWNIMYILVVTIFAVVLVRQFNYRVSRGKPTVRAFFMFPKITKPEADKNLKTFVMYMFNYGFYKFGLEICLMATVAVIGFRMDMYSIIYSLWLCGLFVCKRETVARIWYFYLIFIALVLPFQYVMTVGLPPTLCISFPWDVMHWAENGTKQAEIFRRLQDWAYLLDTEYPPASKKLVCDFILLLLVSRQAVVFRIEKRWRDRIYPGGCNESIIHFAEERNFENPLPDYISYTRSYLDAFKKAVFNSFLWITLAIVFLAGTNRVNIFSIGYLIGAFVFLWHGTDLYLRPIPKIIRTWDLFLGYNVFVILCKTLLQIAGCIFIQNIPLYACWLIQLFGIGCVKKFGDLTQQAGMTSDDYCKVPRETVGLVWDGICFGFMIMQRRIFNSYNFFHLVNETKAAAILASRGAELIEELRLKRMMEQEEQEKRVLEKIKMKMDRIKANQQRIQGTAYKQDEHHYADALFKRPRRRRKEPNSKKQAVRSGDYYMFDDLDDEEELDFMEEPDEANDDDLNVQHRLTVGEIDETKTVRIIDSRQDPQPSTSKVEDVEKPMPEVRSFWKKLQVFLLFIWVFIQSAMISLTNFLNRYSRDYRYVLRVLAKEKQYLKENTQYYVGLRLGSGQMWQPAGSYGTLIRGTLHGGSALDYEDYEATELSSYDQPPFIRLLIAIWYIVMSRSENVCYFIIFLNQIKSATFLSLPLPLMVFFWGTLTIPRPDKTFWVTIIAYTEIIVLIKCMFQFEIIPWNQSPAISSNPFYPPRIIGIERDANYAVWDLWLLLVVFFHRYMLKSMGLWKTSPIPAAIITDGDYKITATGSLEAVESSDTFLSSKKGAKKSSTSSKGSMSKASDLQRLVEEDETREEDRKGGDGSTESLRNLELDENHIVTIQTKKINPFTNLSYSLQLVLLKYGEGFTSFFKQLKDPTSRVAADVYSYMFLCDFYNFFVILLGYSSFGTQQGDVSSYLEDDRVPALFLVMLIIQFTLIIVDRGIFLRKNILAKIIFQFIQIFTLHIWLFIAFPLITERGFNSVVAPQMYYMVKCFYLLLSAYQIRCGYPTRILGNFLCKGYNYVNMFLFKGFMAIPFLFELRTVMDWMWTDTSMTVWDWIKMEDIFAHIFQIKCSRHAEDEYPQPRGTRTPAVSKYLMGGAILIMIIAIIWFPLVFFSLGNAVGTANPPYDVTLEIRIGPYEPVYTMSAQSNSITQFTDSNLHILQQTYIQEKMASTIISNYEGPDIAAVKLSSDSANVWSISPPDRDRMLHEVNSTSPLKIRLDYKVSHKTSKPEDSGVIPDNSEITLPALVDGKPNEMRQNLLKMLKGDKSAPPMVLKYIMPKFLKVTNRGSAKPISQFMYLSKEDAESTSPVGQSFRTIHLSLNASNGTDAKEWWTIQEECGDYNFNTFLKKIPYVDCESIMLYTFNDKIFPSTLNILTGGGIIGLYSTLVFVAFRFFRGFFAEQCFKIMFEDMPNIDRVLQLCLDIYLVREAAEFKLEEDLFAKLVFLFRSPETMIKWTRPKEELADDEDPEA